MARVDVFCRPMRVFSTSPAALSNPVGILHTVATFVDKDRWKRTPAGPERTPSPGVLTACGSRIHYQLHDTEIRHGKPRPTKLCKRCAQMNLVKPVPFVEVSVVGWSVVPGLDAETGQGTLLS